MLLDSVDQLLMAVGYISDTKAASCAMFVYGVDFYKINIHSLKSIYKYRTQNGEYKRTKNKQKINKYTNTYLKKVQLSTKRFQNPSDPSDPYT